MEHLYDVYKKNFAWEDQSRKQFYIAVIEPEMCEHAVLYQVVIEREIKMEDFIPFVFTVYTDEQGSKQ